MSVEVLHSHAVDSLLRAHRPDAARCRRRPSAATRAKRSSPRSALAEYGEPPRSSTGTCPGRAGAARPGARSASRRATGRPPSSAASRKHDQGAVRRRHPAPARPDARALAHALRRRDPGRDPRVDRAVLRAARDRRWSPARARSAGQLWRLDRYYAGNWPSTNTVVRRFGTFSAAVRKAGLEPRPRGRTPAPRRRSPSTRARSSAATRHGQPHLRPAVLAARVRSVAAAKTAQDPTALRGALIDLAAAALSWADV